ncbi:insecticidal delta-endotoxin Cry8Ea1 family protein [Bacillus thuringiensis]|uniref:Crystaline entomocidal protoxin n=1 Tax=Bacillus thuringiensis TaxID=1428 RepID=A0A9X6TKU6_BACTU|nr:insecticidal delta-endotoxin Cry8Ea1 family protein [Bacillus thuringiensis]PEA88281.1 hypothetical protein CON71_19900 [Bacillus thuringiensis]
MSSYNKNPFETIKELLSNANVSITCPLHPLAKEPTAVLQGMNYKDWLVMSEEENSLGKPENFDSETIQNALIGTLAVIGFIASVLITPITGGASVAIGSALLLETIPYYWGLAESEDPTIQEKAMFDDIMKATEKTIKSEIEKVVKTKAESELTSLRDVFKYYTRALNLWKENKDNQDARKEVSSRFRAAHVAFIGAMSQFKMPGYELVMLPIYAAAANFHLMLLQDGMIYEKEWNESNNLTEDFYYKEYQNWTSQYIDHCTSWYQKGLKDIKDNKEKNWVDYNSYRNNMTILVLDLIALFPSYDVRQYNNMGVKLETHTRTLYSNPLKFSKGSRIDDDERVYTREPNLFSSLSHLEFHTRTTNLGSDGIEFLSGIEKKYQLTEKESYRTKFEGKPTDIGKKHEIPFKKDESEFYSLYELSTEGKGFKDSTKLPLIQKMTFNNEEGKKFEYSVDKFGNGALEKESFSITNPDDLLADQKARHVLSDIIFVDDKNISPEQIQTRDYSFAWTSEQISPYNRITDGTKNKDGSISYQITQVPAVKAYSLKSSKDTSHIDVISGPGFTGGDLVRCAIKKTASSTGVTQLSIVFPITFNHVKTDKYRVRMNYAADHTKLITLVGGSNPISGTIENTFDAKDTGKSLKYNNFKMMEFNIATNFKDEEKQKIITLKLTYADDDQAIADGKVAQLWIDKLEFIPVPTK